MPYELAFNDNAFASFKSGLPLSLVEAIQEGLLELANDPVGKSVRPIIPRKWGGQDFYFTAKCWDGGEDEVSFRLRAGFVYLQDEKTLLIVEVMYQRHIL